MRVILVGTKSDLQVGRIIPKEKGEHLFRNLSKILCCRFFNILCRQLFFGAVFDGKKSHQNARQQDTS